MSNRSLLILITASLLSAPFSGAQTRQDRQDRKILGSGTLRPQQDQEPVKVFTEEVRLSVAADDDTGRPDPTLNLDDVLVIEDGVHQQIRSVRHVPASVLLVLETSGDMDPAIRTNITRDVAVNLVRLLPAGDRISALQFADRVELLQDWTLEKAQAEKALHDKLHSAHGSHLARALTEAAKQLGSQPPGNRHVVIVTNGVDVPPLADYKEAMKALDPNGPFAEKSKTDMAQAVKLLNAAQATVHVISYTSVARHASKKAKDSATTSPVAQDIADMTVVGIDPTLPPGMRRAGSPAPPQVGTGITFDPQMRRLRKAYERAIQRSEEQMSGLAQEMGGRIWLPSSTSEMIANSKQVARDIGSEYVITYTPSRPLAEAPAGEYRRVEVASRRVGLSLRARRGYVVANGL
jgi:VWFA-related protein